MYIWLFVDPCYWGPELNYEYYDEQQNLKPAWKFVSDVIRYWISEYHLDGIRFDAGRFCRNTFFPLNISLYFQLKRWIITIFFVN